MNATHRFLAFVLCLGLAVSSCYCQHTLRQEMENLKKYFNSSSPDVGDNGDLHLLDILRNWQNYGDTKIIESQIVSFYLKLFDALKHNQDIQNSISSIREELRISFFNGSTERMNDFQKIANISVNDLQVQRQAFNELIKVMYKLSPNFSQRKRKRSRCCFGGAEHQNKNNLASTI